MEAHANPILVQAAIYFAAAVVAVLLSHRLGVGAIAGYLLAGIVLGPWGFNLVGDPKQIHAFAELGVVFLLFVIGLELEPRRLWEMRVPLFGLGFAQVAGCTLAIAGIGWALGADPGIALIAGMALSMSSTPLGLQPLAERDAMNTAGGQASFAIHLFQDLAVIPMLALVPFIAASTAPRGEIDWHDWLYPLTAVVATLVCGHYLARPVFRHIARTHLREIFTAFALFLVLGIGLGFEAAGLSMALGAFLAGVLLADSEYRHEIEAAVDPFKGLLLGLFFMSVGLAADFSVLLQHPLIVLGIVAGLYVAKGLVLWAIVWRTSVPRVERPLFILLLAQGGEFAFVLLGPAAGGSVLPKETSDVLILAVALSMLASPLLLLLHDRFVLPRLGDAGVARAHDTPQAGKVILAGLGRVGQVVARLLSASGYAPVVLDDDPDHVEQSRKFGFRAFYGDATRVDLLHAAGADSAAMLIVTLDDAQAATRLIENAKKHFPHLRIVARARDMRHLFHLRDLGVGLVERETWLGALKLGETALAALTGDAARASRATQAFQAHDREVMAKLYEVHRGSPDTQVEVSNQLRDKFARTLQEEEGPGPAPT